MNIAIVNNGEENMSVLINCAEEICSLEGERGNIEVWNISCKNGFLMPCDCVKYLSGLIEDHRPDVVLAAGNRFGNELALRLACALGGGYALNAERLRKEKDSIIAVRRAYASNLFAEFKLKEKPYILTISDGAYQDEKENLNTVKTTEIDIDALLPEYCVSRRFIPEKIEENRLEDAELVVAGGRGMGSKEKTAELDELAELLGAGVGSSRPPVLDAWTSHSRLIGASGKSVRPELCLTFGISGAGPFMAGVEKSGTIAAVNTDPDALIFHYCDYGVVADCNEAAEALKEILKEEEGQND